LGAEALETLLAGKEAHGASLLCFAQCRSVGGVSRYNRVLT